MDLGLAGRTVMVTGASGGIGGEIARQLVREQARVVVHYHHNRATAEELVQELTPQNATAEQADLTCEDQVAELFSRAEDRWGPIHHLICNAGVWPPHDRPLRQMSFEQWQQTLAVDLNSVFLCCRQFLQSVERQRIADPSIVLIGSTAGVFGEAGHGDYAAAKSALIGGLMNTLKNEIVQIAPLGRVNSVSPGWTITPMTQKFAADSDQMSRAVSTIALKKVGAATDIAHAIAFLTSPTAAGHISGQNLIVSGGMEGRLLHPY